MMDTEAQRKYYTYTYAYPDGTVFYVGKGCNDRIDAHEREARKGCKCKKCRVIRKIWDSGEQVRKAKIYETDSESDAFRHEKECIKVTFKSPHLTNKANHDWLYYMSLSAKKTAQLKMSMREGVDKDR